MSTPQELASTFLAGKLREYCVQSNVPALAGVLVWDWGVTVVTGQEGIREVGGSGPNAIEPQDRFNIGSVSKVLAAQLIGTLFDHHSDLSTFVISGGGLG